MILGNKKKKPLVLRWNYRCPVDCGWAGLYDMGTIELGVIGNWMRLQYPYPSWVGLTSRWRKAGASWKKIAALAKEIRRYR